MADSAWRREEQRGEWEWMDGSGGDWRESGGGGGGEEVGN